MELQRTDCAVGDGEHAVHFYAHDTELLGALTPYLKSALQAGDVAIVIATEAHRNALRDELQLSGIDLAELSDAGRFISLDAASTLASFVDEDGIDHDAFHEVLGGLLSRTAQSTHAVRVYGEMVALLWQDGHVLSAIELEGLWNDLASELQFSLFCAYPAASVAAPEHADALHQVCHLHSSVLHAPSGLDLRDADRSAETELYAEFPCEPTSPGQARRLITSALSRAGHDEALVNDVALVVSELTTNAVVHARSGFSISLSVKDTALRIAVRDSKPLAATAAERGLIVRRGHGLDVIALLSSSWGVEERENGKVVWAELSHERASSLF